MPNAQINGTTLYFEDHGTGPETIVFSHGLLWSGQMFDPQVVALRARYRCITYDHRGQGRSAVPDDGYDIDTVTDDAAALIELLGAAPCHFVGLSMGGFVGMRLALRHPELLRSLILLNTSADPEPPENIPRYRMLARIARWLGMRPVAGRVMPILFGRAFLTDPSRAALRRSWHGRLLENDRRGATKATLGVVERDGVYEELAQIPHPTLVIAGEADVATVPAKGRRIAERIPNARFALIPRAGHTSSIEESALVTETIRSFLDDLTADG